MLLVMWVKTIAGAVAPPFLPSPAAGSRLPIDVPPFHSAEEGTGCRKAGQKAGQRQNNSGGQNCRQIV
jgi:hypothetical protein